MYNRFQYYSHLFALLAVAGLTCNALGQAGFQENFDTGGPIGNLTDQGWDFRVQADDTVVGVPFSYSLPSHFPQSGEHCLWINVDLTNGSPQVSAWILLPEVPNQIASDPLTFWIEGEFDQEFEVRYSPTGGTSTGSSPTDVGDYTEVLLSESVTPVSWQERTVNVPGDGRLAIRLIAYDVDSFSGGMEGFIDTLSVGDDVPCSICNLPLPAARETVHWDSSLDPIVIDEPIEIVVGGTVIVDPGVDVTIENAAIVDVNGNIEFREGTSLTAELISGPSNNSLRAKAGGEIRFLGTQAQPINITGGGIFTGAIDLRERSRLIIEHANVDGTIAGDWTFNADGAPVIHARNCTFTAPSIYLLAGTLVLEDCVFDGTKIDTEEVYHVFRNLTLQNEAIIETYRADLGQPIVFDTITASGVSDDSPFQLFGNMHHFGPNNNIAGNKWPVRLSGGLTRDSVIPTRGNTINEIAISGMAGARVNIPNLDVPYHGLEGLAGRHVDVDPGVVFKMAPGAKLGPSGGGGDIYEINLRGTPAEPIVMEPLVPGQKWGGLYWLSDGERATTDWIIVDNAERGADADECTFWMQNAVFRNCDTGGYSRNLGRGRYRSCVFIDNGIGIDTSEGLPGSGFFAGNFDAQSQTNPNSFIGNSIGARDRNTSVASLAAYSWWGDPSGPQNPANPGGTGDPVEGPVQFTPFLTSPPNPNDHPPSVRFIGLEEIASPGDRIILRWEGGDDHPIDHFRLEFVDDHGCAGSQYSIFEDDIPGDRRSTAVEIPPYVSSGCNNFNRPAFKIVAVDSAGQEGLHVWDYLLEELSGIPGPEIPVFPQPVRPGDVFPDGNPDGELVIVYDDSNLAGFGQGLSSWVKMPPVSTDLARVAMAFNSTADQTFGDYFEIRPDPAITGDFPPEITMLSPQHGDSFNFGSSVPITWSASDDQSIRSYEIQVSYDGGREWHRIVTDLDASATSYDFDLPPSDLGIDDVRLRVLVRDSMFQVSSDGTNRVISLNPSDGNPAGDLNGDGVVDGSDLGIMLGAFGLNNPNADLNNDGTVDGADLGLLLGAWTG